MKQLHWAAMLHLYWSTRSDLNRRIICFAGSAIRPLWYLCLNCLATPHGFEPRLRSLELRVLPLHYGVFDTTKIGRGGEIRTHETCRDQNPVPWAAWRLPNKTFTTGAPTKNRTWNTALPWLRYAIYL
jgi:hypothetical protein